MTNTLSIPSALSFSASVLRRAAFVALLLGTTTLATIPAHAGDAGEAASFRISDANDAGEGASFRVSDANDAGEGASFRVSDANDAGEGASFRAA